MLRRIAVHIGVRSAFLLLWPIGPAALSAEELWRENPPVFQLNEPDYYQEPRLNAAYRDQSSERLQEFLEGWQKTFPSISDGRLSQLPEVARHAYAVFRDFYTPKNLGRLGREGPDADPCGNARYLITQQSLPVAVFEHLPEIHAPYVEPIYALSIDDFRPQVMGGAPVLTLNDHYERMLAKFLGMKAESIRAGNSIGVQSGEESRRRLDFLNQFTCVSYTRGWEVWSLLTLPVVSSIQFDSKFKHARVNFKLILEGGEALYERNGNVWRLVKAGRTWVN